jgi:VIT1/CCC1 family predicted Fe2+/Mn2+ transporter
MVDDAPGGTLRFADRRARDEGLVATPFLFVSTVTAGIALSLGCSAVALLLLGFMTHVLTGRGLWYSGIRQLLIGLLAAGITYGMGALAGHVFGVQVAG